MQNFNISTYKQLLFLTTYLILRLFSYLYQPGHMLNTVIAIVILLATTYLLIRKDERGWYIIAGEIILAGAGHFYEIAGLSLRTLLLISSLSIYSFQKLTYLGRPNQKQLNHEDKIYLLFTSLFFVLIIFSSVKGYFGPTNNQKQILSDVIPYLFLLYYFPLKDLLKTEEFKTTTINLLFAAIIGNALFVLMTFFLYSSSLFQLQDGYYHWFRDIAGGKITDYGLNFYRIVLNEQLLLIPVAIYLISSKISKLKSFPFTIIALLLVTLSTNLTRVFILALAIGLALLATKTSWKRWLAYSAATLLVFFASFTLLHVVASRGQSLGWELFGLRLQSITSPQIEESSLSRILLLPKIWEKIKTHPIIGNGLGDTVTVYSPVVRQEITTTQFDWGYLEIWDELGIIGMLTWLALIIYTLGCLFKSSIPNKKGLVASVITLLVVNLTSPALFHVMGIIWLVLAISIYASSKQSPEPGCTSLPCQT